MAIYRGSGGSTSTTDQATIDQVAEDAATATTKATEAANSASSAATSASSASTSATNAASSASSASSSASSASTSASNASTSASSASTSATAAAASATTADASDTNAAASAAAALSSKALALDAQTAAETAESNASDHADDAVKTAYGAEDVLQTLSDSSTLYSARHYAAKASADSATATTKASEASSSASAAASSASAAQAAEDAALAALDSFDDRYLGQKTSDPTTDNDGDALVAGALYYNTTDDIMKVYDGSVWVAAYASLSGTLVAANNLSDVASVSAARTNLGLGTAATTASTDYATAAQGTAADSAMQDLSDDTTPQLGGTLDTNGNNIQVADNDKIRFGLTNDLNIYSDGTNAIIEEASPGHLYIRGDELYLQNAAGTETKASFITNGEARLHFDSSLKLQTTITGADVTGTLTADGIDMEDNHKILLGNSDDLEIYHDGSNSYIDNVGTGNLYIKDTNGTGDIYIQPKSGETAIACFNDSQVYLYYDNQVKLATGSTGITTYGTIFADGLDMGDNEKVLLGNSDDLSIYHDGSNSIIEDVGTGDLRIMGYNIAIGVGTGTSPQTLIQSSSPTTGKYSTKLNFVTYGSASTKLETTQTGVSVTGTCTATSFSGDGSSLTGIATDLVDDTTPQLGGDLDTNGNAIDFGASGWSIALSGTDLVFSYGGVAKIKFASDGEIVTVDDVTAFGTV